jgi:hypothetical protein
VECRSETEYAGRPTAYTVEGERLEITRLLAEWRTPQGKCFRVQAQNGQVFELCYSEVDDAWSLLQRT